MSKVELCVKIISDIMELLFRTDIGPTLHDITEMMLTVLRTVIQTTIAMDRESPLVGNLVAVMLAIFRQMTAHHFEKYISHFSTTMDLLDFLMEILLVFKDLVSRPVFSRDWCQMIMLQNSVILKSLRFFSHTIRDYFFQPFEIQAWNNFFHCAIAFLTQPSLQLETFSQNKRSRIVARYKDMRRETSFEIRAMPVQDLVCPPSTLSTVANSPSIVPRPVQDLVCPPSTLSTVTSSPSIVPRPVQDLVCPPYPPPLTLRVLSPGQYKILFVPGLVGSFLEMTLIPETELRRATIPIFFDMMQCEFYSSRLSGEGFGDTKRDTTHIKAHFAEFENEMIAKLDILVEGGRGDELYKDLFCEIMMNLCEKHSTMREQGIKFVKTVTRLMERLLEYRCIITDENKENRMSCTVNLLDFYSEINRKEMYIRYVNKLCDLHLECDNYTEAAYTLKLHSKLLNWSDTTLPPLLKSNKFPHCQTHRELKEALYYHIMDYFDKGKMWECALTVCKELVTQYEEEIFDYIQLSSLLKRMSQFYDSIMKQIRPEPEYFRVAFYGRGFPAFLQNKVFVYRGKEYERLSDFCSRTLNQLPNAELMSKLTPPGEDVTESQHQCILARFKDPGQLLSGIKSRQDLLRWPNGPSCSDVQINKVDPLMDERKQRLSGKPVNDQILRYHRRSVLVGEGICSVFLILKNPMDDRVEKEAFSASQVNKKKAGAGSKHGRPHTHIYCGSRVNDVQKFRFSRPFHRRDPGVTGDADNEFASLWLERTVLVTSYPLPGILRWFPVTSADTYQSLSTPLYRKSDVLDQETTEAGFQRLLTRLPDDPQVSPLRNAIETMEGSNRTLRDLIVAHRSDPSLQLNPLSMKINGIVDAAVMGGITNYEKAFFQPEYSETHADDAASIDKLKDLIASQIPLLEVAIQLHRQRAPVSLGPFQQRLEECFSDMQTHVEHNYGKKSTDLRLDTPHSVTMRRQFSGVTGNLDHRLSEVSLASSEGNRSRVSSLTRSQVATLKNFATNFNFANLNANAALGRFENDEHFVYPERSRASYAMGSGPYTPWFPPTPLLCQHQTTTPQHILLPLPQLATDTKPQMFRATANEQFPTGLTPTEVSGLQTGQLRGVSGLQTGQPKGLHSCGCALISENIPVLSVQATASNTNKTIQGVGMMSVRSAFRVSAPPHLIYISTWALIVGHWTTECPLESLYQWDTGRQSVLSNPCTRHSSPGDDIVSSRIFDLPPGSLLELVHNVRSFSHVLTDVLVCFSPDSGSLLPT
uniref:DOCKER domain-containing protein n=1 Tax=Timema shepardi TaxID=629360 RepID=A0A7R9B1C3_TIMSH|nr:unnamed protein product [Timema shepardi]